MGLVSILRKAQSKFTPITEFHPALIRPNIFIAPVFSGFLNEVSYFSRSIDVKEVFTKIDRAIPFIVNNTTSPIKVDENNAAFNSYLDSLTTDNLKCIVENGNGFRLSNNKIDPTDIKQSFASYKKLYFKGQCLPMVLLEDENTDAVVEGMLPKAKKIIFKKLEDQANMLLLNINYYESRSRKTN